MNNTLIFVLILIAGVVVGAVWGERKRNSQSSKMIGREELISKQTIEKEKNKKKILEYLKSGFNSSDGQVRITNNDVEKLTGVSDATAERYLDELEQEGKIKQIGKTGNAVYYELI